MFKKFSLLKTKAFIGGRWTGAADGKNFDVLNPATGKVIASVPDMGEKDTHAAINAAESAMKSWKFLTGKERCKYLYQWFTLIRDRTDELAEILTLEQGKPLEESKGEVLGGAAFVEWAAEEAKRVYGDFIPGHKADTKIIVTREPIGIVGAITPWNFPSSMITRKVAPALAAGCAVVLKPAEDTPLSALALAALAEEAGIPAGVFNIVTASLENAPAVGKTLTSDERVRKISFTGSTEVGRLLMRQSADQIKKISLELGGNAPFIVFESADLDKAVDGAIVSKFRNAGQTCICANRIYVHSSLYDAFAKKMTEKVKAMALGPGDRKGVKIGPLINKQGLDKVGALYADATQKGAKTLTGGKKPSLGGMFFEPTVLAGMHDTMAITHEEIFGPIAALYTFDGDEEVIARANDTPYGLAAYIYSNDQNQIWKVTDGLEYGMVAVNEPLLSTELAPFGGVKQSGIGREGSKYGIAEFTSLKYRLFGGL